MSQLARARLGLGSGHILNVDTVIPGMRPGEIPIPASQIPVSSNTEHGDPNYAGHEQRSGHPGTALLVASVTFPNPT